MNQEIDRIIASEINGTATESEKEALKEWIKTDPLNEGVYENITGFLATKYANLEIINEEEVRDQIWKKAHNGSVGKTRRFFYPRMVKIAAAVLILIVSGIAVFNFVNKQITSQTQNEISLIEKVTLPGVKSTIHLPDGSKVILNSSSNISFAEKFSDSVRWVKLEGEAFFDVAKNPDKPFIVQSGNILTRAIGTSFNIKSHSSSVDVSLVEGIVAVKGFDSRSEVESTILNSGEYISYEGDKIKSTGNFNVRDVIGWKDGLLIFKNADFETAIGKLENWYGVHITTVGSVPHWSLNGTYDNDNLENILKALSHSQNFKYEISGNNIKINL
ncbi:FecR domain-containing protein [Reichenbachiella sp. MALMAid0571]|uniref:FecR family protein n=1 Tax=Reichenbachiella sp. MALMAid0571 TaxID=3143939 RepID=UPI0032DEA06E